MPKSSDHRQCVVSILVISSEIIHVYVKNEGTGKMSFSDIDLSVAKLLQSARREYPVDYAYNGTD